MLRSSLGGSVFGIAQSHEAGAVDVLIANARSHAEASIRGEALFWLAQRAGGQQEAVAEAQSLAVGRDHQQAGNRDTPPKAGAFRLERCPPFVELEIVQFHHGRSLHLRSRVLR